MEPRARFMTDAQRDKAKQPQPRVIPALRRHPSARNEVRALEICGGTDAAGIGGATRRRNAQSPTPRHPGQNGNISNAERLAVLGKGSTEGPPDAFPAPAKPEASGGRGRIAGRTSPLLFRCEMCPRPKPRAYCPVQYYRHLGGEGSSCPHPRAPRKITDFLG